DSELGRTGQSPNPSLLIGPDEPVSVRGGRDEWVFLGEPVGRRQPGDGGQGVPRLHQRRVRFADHRFSRYLLQNHREGAENEVPGWRVLRGPEVMAVPGRFAETTSRPEGDL